PQCLPLSVEKSMPHWLNPTRLSFWPAVRCVGLDGSNAMSSSAWRRKVQSWLTRLLPLPLSRLAQPSEPGPEPVASPARPKSAPQNEAPGREYRILGRCFAMTAAISEVRALESWAYWDHEASRRSGARGRSAGGGIAGDGKPERTSRAPSRAWRCGSRRLRIRV